MVNGGTCAGRPVTPGGPRAALEAAETLPWFLVEGALPGPFFKAPLGRPGCPRSGFDGGGCNRRGSELDVEGLTLAAEAAIEIDLGELIWSAVSFVIFAAVLAKVLWQPVIQMLDERSKEVETNLEMAAASRAEAEQAQAEYTRRLSEAQREAQQIIEKALRAGEGQREELLKKAHDEAEQILDRARTTIARERDEAVLELRRQVAEITIAATEQLLQRTMDDEDHRRLAEDVVARVGAGYND